MHIGGVGTVEFSELMGALRLRKTCLIAEKSILEIDNNQRLELKNFGHFASETNLFGDLHPCFVPKTNVSLFVKVLKPTSSSRSIQKHTFVGVE